jgi:ferrous iron transport protein A
LTGSLLAIHNRIVLQMVFNRAAEETGPRDLRAPATLAELSQGQRGVLESLDVPDDVARRLMQLGFLPGSTVTAARSAPGGDPRVFRVDGSEIALRRETAARIRLRRGA